MSFAVIHDGEDPQEHGENCAFCFVPTHYWARRKDVAVCQNCAKTHRLKQLPTKAQWCDAVGAAMKSGVYVSPVTKQSTPVKVLNARLNIAVPDYERMKKAAGPKNLYHVHARMDSPARFMEFDGVVDVTGMVANAEDYQILKTDVRRVMLEQAGDFDRQLFKDKAVVIHSLSHLGEAK